MDFSTSGLNSWQLKVLSTGDIQLMSLEDQLAESSDFVCNKNVFKVLNSYDKYSSYRGDWEESVTKVKLVLGDCREDTAGRRECAIRIKDGVGLQFNPEYKPKVIFVN